MKDAPEKMLQNTLSTASMKNVVETSLFCCMKSFTTPQCASHLVGYVFAGVKMGGDNPKDKKCFWAAACEYIVACTASLWEQPILNRRYPVGYGNTYIPFP